MEQKTSTGIVRATTTFAQPDIPRQLPAPRTVAAGAGWMNGDQPDKCLSAASFCPAGIHLSGGGNPAQQDKTAGNHGV